MTTATTPASHYHAAAEKIRDSLDADVWAIRQQKLGDTRAYALIAEAYLKHRDNIDALNAGMHEQHVALYNAVFSFADITPDDPAGQASLAISTRDAYDRVTHIDSTAEARTLLRNAQETGDEVLSRAVFARLATTELGDYDDGELIQQFLSTRPAKAATYAALTANNWEPAMLVPPREVATVYGLNPDRRHLEDRIRAEREEEARRTNVLS